MCRKCYFSLSIFDRAPTKNYCVESIELFHKQALLCQLSKYIIIMRLKCEVGYEKKTITSSVEKKQNYFPNNPIFLQKNLFLIFFLYLVESRLFRRD